MPIRFRCDQCKTRIKVPDGSEGANVRCPRCHQRQRVPIAARATAMVVAGFDAPDGGVIERAADASAPGAGAGAAMDAPGVQRMADAVEPPDLPQFGGDDEHEDADHGHADEAPANAASMSAAEPAARSLFQQPAEPSAAEVEDATGEAVDAASAGDTAGQAAGEARAVDDDDAVSADADETDDAMSRPVEAMAASAEVDAVLRDDQVDPQPTAQAGAAPSQRVAPPLPEEEMAPPRPRQRPQPHAIPVRSHRSRPQAQAAQAQAAQVEPARPEHRDTGRSETSPANAPADTVASRAAAGPGDGPGDDPAVNAPAVTAPAMFAVSASASSPVRGAAASATPALPEAPGAPPPAVKTRPQARPAARPQPSPDRPHVFSALIERVLGVLTQGSQAPLTSSNLAVLHALAWVLRGLALLMVGVATKKIMIQIDLDRSIVEVGLAAIENLTIPLIVWAAAEIAAAVRAVATRATAGGA